MGRQELPGSIQGTVDGGGHPVEEVELLVCPVGGGETECYYAETNANGGYDVEEVPAGTYEVTAEPEFEGAFAPGNSGPVTVNNGAESTRQLQPHQSRCGLDRRQREASRVTVWWHQRSHRGSVRGGRRRTLLSRRNRQQWELRASNRPRRRIHRPRTRPAESVYESADNSSFTVTNAVESTEDFSFNRRTERIVRRDDREHGIRRRRVVAVGAVSHRAAASPRRRGANGTFEFRSSPSGPTP